MPDRIQLSRAKGWRMPPNTVKVDRRTIWGNPWGVGPNRGYSVPMSVSPWWLHLELFIEAAPLTADVAVAAFRAMLAGEPLAPALLPMNPTPDERNRVMRDLSIRREQLLSRLPELRGKNLACWCKPGCACHADVLLEMANA